jgi:hypothetical protein
VPLSGCHQIKCVPGMPRTLTGVWRVSSPTSFVRKRGSIDAIGFAQPFPSVVSKAIAYFLIEMKVYYLARDS